MLHRPANGEVVTTWHEVVSRARRLAAALDLLDVPRHARVGTFGWNSQRHVELYLAVPSGGRVLHTRNHRLFATEPTYILNDASGSGSCRRSQDRDREVLEGGAQGTVRRAPPGPARAGRTVLSRRASA
ncbi:AMP-binding protein [Actinoallomurus iriomotensis]|uniref:AMP-dependent synthetase/ligase domain-containing protein n=1 Tax=Actinoallomurus iriomotensis TaxID=478107 RepID=A0A9W6RB76_9ACTN|nr:AMP-binding protein [Actinoallomurus iriomotensis]GLY72721.1 hypothetical protein Airi01_009880 [Actinoallomurus iriomotensis]